MPEFNKGDRVRVRLASHSPYRGQIGVVDDNPLSYSPPSTRSSGFWYMVRFEWKGLRPAARFMEEDLEVVLDEIHPGEAPAPIKLTERSQRSVGSKIIQVSTKRKYLLIALIVALTLTAILVAYNTGKKINSPTLSGFSSTPTRPPLLTQGSSNETMKLAFAAELVGATAGSALPIQPIVRIVDANGNIVTASTAPVTLVVNDDRATLYGTRTVNAVNGVATFTDLSIRLAGLNYKLMAISRGVTSALSDSFNVAPGAATTLAFTKVPDKFEAGSTLTKEVKVNIVDAYGNTVTTSAAPVTVAITPGTGANGAVLFGTKTVNAVNGVATWANLSVNLRGSGYTLTATSPGLASAISYPFNVR